MDELIIRDYFCEVEDLVGFNIGFFLYKKDENNWRLKITTDAEFKKHEELNDEFNHCVERFHDLYPAALSFQTIQRLENRLYGAEILITNKQNLI